MVLSGICTTRRQGRTVPRRSRVGLGVFITRRQGGGVSQDRPRWSVYPGCRQGSTESRPGSLHYPQAGWWGSPGKWALWSVRGAVLPAGRVDSSPKKTKNLTSARHQHKTTRQLTTTHAGTHQLEGERLFFTSLLSLFLCDRRRDSVAFPLSGQNLVVELIFFYSFFQGGYDCDTTPCHRLHAVFGAAVLEPWNRSGRRRKDEKTPWPSGQRRPERKTGRGVPSTSQR